MTTLELLEMAGPWCPVIAWGVEAVGGLQPATRDRVTITWSRAGHSSWAPKEDTGASLILELPEPDVSKPNLSASPLDLLSLDLVASVAWPVW